MKTTVLSVLGCVIIATGALQARAQTGTNVTLGVNIALTGVAPTNTDSTTRVHITTKDVINAISAVVSVTPTAKTRLVLVFASGGGNPSFKLRDGTNDTDIAGGVLGVDRVVSVKSSRPATSTGLLSGTETAIDHIVLNTPTLAFDVQGYSTDSFSNRGITGHTILDDTTPVSYTSKVNGTGSGDSVL